MHDVRSLGLFNHIPSPLLLVDCSNADVDYGQVFAPRHWA